MNFKSFLRKIAPTVGLAVGGPLGGIVAGELAKKLNVDVSEIESVYEKDPESVRLAALELESEMVKANAEIAKGQIDLLKLDIATKSFFQRGWRPCVSWVLVGSFFINLIIVPITNIILALLMIPIIIPNLPLEVSGPMLAGLLGLSHHRSKDKREGIDSN